MVFHRCAPERDDPVMRQMRVPKKSNKREQTKNAKGAELVWDYFNVVRTSLFFRFQQFFFEAILTFEQIRQVKFSVFPEV